MKRLWLPSGRGVRYELLAPTVVDQIIGNAAKEVRGDQTMIELDRETARQGAQSMIKEITRERLMKDDERAAASKDPAAWRKVQTHELAQEWDRLFTPKESDLLGKLWGSHHLASAAEVQAILGKETDETLPAG